MPERTSARLTLAASKKAQEKGDQDQQQTASSLAASKPVGGQRQKRGVGRPRRISVSESSNQIDADEPQQPSGSDLQASAQVASASHPPSLSMEASLPQPSEPLGLETPVPSLSPLLQFGLDSSSPNLKLADLQPHRAHTRGFVQGQQLASQQSAASPSLQSIPIESFASTPVQPMNQLSQKKEEMQGSEPEKPLEAASAPNSDDSGLFKRVLRRRLSAAPSPSHSNSSSVSASPSSLSSMPIAPLILPEQPTKKQPTSASASSSPSHSNSISSATIKSYKPKNWKENLLNASPKWAKVDPTEKRHALSTEARIPGTNYVMRFVPLYPDDLPVVQLLETRQPPQISKTVSLAFEDNCLGVYHMKDGSPVDGAKLSLRLHDSSGRNVHGSDGNRHPFILPFRLTHKVRSSDIIHIMLSKSVIDSDPSVEYVEKAGRGKKAAPAAGSGTKKSKSKKQDDDDASGTQTDTDMNDEPGIIVPSPASSSSSSKDVFDATIAMEEGRLNLRLSSRRGSDILDEMQARAGTMIDALDVTNRHRVFVSAPPRWRDSDSKNGTDIVKVHIVFEVTIPNTGIKNMIVAQSCEFGVASKPPPRSTVDYSPGPKRTIASASSSSSSSVTAKPKKVKGKRRGSRSNYLDSDEEDDEDDLFEDSEPEDELQADKFEENDETLQDGEVDSDSDFMDEFSGSSMQKKQQGQQLQYNSASDFQNYRMAPYGSMSSSVPNASPFASSLESSSSQFKKRRRSEPIMSDSSSSASSFGGRLPVSHLAPSPLATGMHYGTSSGIAFSSASTYEYLNIERSYPRGNASGAKTKRREIVKKRTRQQVSDLENLHSWHAAVDSSSDNDEDSTKLWDEIDCGPWKEETSPLGKEEIVSPRSDAIDFYNLELSDEERPQQHESHNPQYLGGGKEKMHCGVPMRSLPSFNGSDQSHDSCKSNSFSGGYVAPFASLQRSRSLPTEASSSYNTFAASSSSQMPPLRPQHFVSQLPPPLTVPMARSPFLPNIPGIDSLPSLGTNGLHQTSFYQFMNTVQSSSSQSRGKFAAMSPPSSVVTADFLEGENFFTQANGS